MIQASPCKSKTIIILITGFEKRMYSSVNLTNLTKKLRHGGATGLHNKTLRFISINVLKANFEWRLPKRTTGSF
jgi:hypothetical protein